MLALLNLFKKKKEETPIKAVPKERDNEKIALRKGEIGEYKIDIQLSQLPKEYKYFNDLFIENRKSATGYSQIDHVVITPYGIFVIETKNYQGTIYGGKNRKTWLINGKFKMPSPLIQNYGHIEALKRLIDKKYHNKFLSIISFTKRCQLKIDLELREIASDEMVIYDLYLTESIHRKVSILKLKSVAPLLTEEEMINIYQTFETANITDPMLREKHNNFFKERKENKTGTESKSKCVICNKPVTKNVVNYCLTNKRFDGKVYCYEHQR